MCFAAVARLMYFAPPSMLVSSEVIAATFSRAVPPALKATARVSPTFTPCFSA